MTRRHLLALAVLIAVLTAGCGVRPSGVITGGPAPSGPALGRPGSPAPTQPPAGAVLYFVADASLTRVFRHTRQQLSPVRTLTLLQAGPNSDERAAHLTSEVPSGLDPVTVDTSPSGNVDVVVTTDVTTLSGTAVDQIVCTVGAALSTAAAITLTSDGVTRGPQVCPLTG